mmetsp:Transcript_23954/g.52417  ORF Transcript_23954/g.52417 Transcript_23954/m.52417 type:complete len:211 (-) Transcript_23954:253-885(-)
MPICSGVMYCCRLSERLLASATMVSRAMVRRAPSCTTTRPFMQLKFTKGALGQHMMSAPMGSAVAPANTREPSNFQAAKSAAKPGATSPMSSRPRLAAPPLVAIRRASRADSAVGSPPAMLTRCSSMASLASAIRFWLSLQAEPSTPRPTFTPASSIFLTGAMPDAKRLLEEGQWATPMPSCANSAISSSFTMQQCANQQSPLFHPTVLM